MAQVYSIDIMDVQGFSATFDFTVPSSRVLVVRDIDVYASSDVFAPPGHFRFKGNSGGTIWAVTNNPGTTLNEQWRGRQVFDTGESMHIETDQPFDVKISGYLLTTP